MLSFTKRILRKSYYGRKTLDGLRWVYLQYRHHLVPEKIFVKQQYREAFGRMPDLDNPRTLNEKIMWLKLHDRFDLQTQCADKYAVRDYVRSKVGEKYLVPLLFETENPDDIVPERFPETPFIIKTNHLSGNNTIVMNKSAIDWRELRKSLAAMLRDNYYYRSKEFPYKNIRPRIIVETLLQEENGSVPFDYKFHCFNGRVQVIQVDIDRFGNHARNLYDSQWNLQPFTWTQWSEEKPLWVNGKSLPAPTQLPEMITIAETLAADFLCARVDLYEVQGRLYFGEITFYHGSGAERITPPEWDRKLGDRLRLPHEALG